MTTRPDENPPPQVAFVVIDDDLLAVVRGEMDLASNHHLRPAIKAATQRRLNLVADLRDVPFIDMTTAKLLVKAADELHAAGRTVRLVDAAPVVHRLLTLLGWQHLIDDGAEPSPTR